MTAPAKQVYAKYLPHNVKKDKAKEYEYISLPIAEELARITEEIAQKAAMQISDGVLYQENDTEVVAEKYLAAKNSQKQSVPLVENKLEPEKRIISHLSQKYYEEKKIEIEEQKILDFITNTNQKFNNAFQSLHAVLYRQPNEKEQAWFKNNSLPENTPIYIKQPRAVRANIELKQRALSFIEAAWKVACISQPQKTNSQLETIQKKLFEKFKVIQEKIDNAGHSLADTENYNYFLTQEMEKGLFEELKQFLIVEFKVPEKDVSEVLNQFEAIANWERQTKLDKGFAVVTSGVVRVSRPKKIEMTEKQKDEFRNISSTDKKPKWFTDLPALTQAWLLKNAERIINEELSCPPSVVRFIPGLANVREDLEFFMDAKNTVKLSSSNVRIGVPTPVDIKDKKEQKRITELNAEQVVEKFSSQMEQAARFKKHFGNLDNPPKPFAIFQRLLSPVPFADRMGLSGSDNNTLFIETTRAAIEKTKNEKTKICTPNWPINSLRTIATNPFEDKENQRTRKWLGEYVLKLMQTLKSQNRFEVGSQQGTWFVKIAGEGDESLNFVELNILKDHIGKVTGLKPNNSTLFKLAIAAFAQYELLWEQSEKNKIENPHGLNINLRMAALEMIIAEGLGLVDSSGCKSAKDREAVLTMEMTALKTYFSKNNGIPSINNKEHVEEVASYFAKEYLSDYNQEVVSNGNSIGDSAVQNSKGILFMIEKIIEVPQMIPLVYTEQIGKKLISEDPSLGKDPLKVANDEMTRQDNLGKSASWGKVKTGFKKFMHALKEFFSSKKELVVYAQPINLEKKSETIITVPNRWELANSLYIPGCEPVKPFKDDDSYDRNIDEEARKLPAGIRIGNNYTLEPIRQSEEPELPRQYTL